MSRISPEDFIFLQNKVSSILKDIDKDIAWCIVTQALKGHIVHDKNNQLVVYTYEKSPRS